MVSALGLNAAEHEQSFRAEKLGFGPVDRFDLSQRTAKTAALVTLPKDRLFPTLSARHEARIDHGTRMLMHATREALAQARLPDLSGVHGVFIGTSAAAMEYGERYTRALRVEPRRQRGQLTALHRYQPQVQMQSLVAELRGSQPAVIVSNACASGANAIGMGMELLRTGRAQCVIVGGYDAISELVFAGFDVLRALAPSGVPRPFDAQRDGLALGEGAGVMVLETSGHAHARGATPMVELCGYHTATDLHHLTQPDPTGSSAVRTMNGACVMAGLTPVDIHYINSHGTGTPFNDVAEGAAICAWAGDAAQQIAVSSTKSAMGHLLGGAGAIEAAICVQAIAHQWVPASLNIRSLDPICAFDVVQSFRPMKVTAALTNSFGFGGTNATLTFRAV
jgi:3-oxoacyl-[acyl-carrier-protein] synthase II